MANRHNGHHPEVLVRTSQEVNEELLGRTFHAGPRFWLVAAVLAALLALGVIGFMLRARDGFDDHRPWGYLAAVFAFILTTGMSAPLVAIAPRMARAHFSRPISRAAELWAVAGLFNVLLLVPLLMALPSGVGRSTFWFVRHAEAGPFSTWPAGAPHVWTALAVVFLVLNGLALLWAGAIPDLAVARDRAATGFRASLYRRLSLGWQGTKGQWRRLRSGIGVLGGLYFMFLVYVHTVVAFDFAESLVPGWKDSIFPAYHALIGLQSAVATVIVTAFVLRTFGGLKEYIGINQFWSLAKLLLALTLLWGYFWWSGFIVYWYGRLPLEQNVLRLFMLGPYKPLFLTIFALSFLAPAFGLLIWNPIRKSILGPTVAASLILAGNFLERIRVYVAAHSVGLKGQEGSLDLRTPPAEFAQQVSAVFPDGADVLMVVGALAGAILVYLLATKLIPIVSIWETKEGLILQQVRPLEKARLKVLAKPE
jgi:molybdopterin-containing oxidoreductase family membrane subunit